MYFVLNRPDLSFKRGRCFRTFITLKELTDLAAQVSLARFGLTVKKISQNEVLVEFTIYLGHQELFAVCSSHATLFFNFIEVTF